MSALWQKHMRERSKRLAELENEVEALRAALIDLIELEDVDLQRPPWTYITDHRLIACRYCGRSGDLPENIVHAEDICPIAKAKDAIRSVS